MDKKILFKGWEEAGKALNGYACLMQGYLDSQLIFNLTGKTK